MRIMNRVAISIISLFLFSNLLFAEEPDFVGSWKIEPISKSSGEFPWWHEIKYPIKLDIVEENGTLELVFEDQFNFVCRATPLMTNRESELVFDWCGSGGTKNPASWAPIHHAKIVNGKLIGVVSTDRILFKWKGQRVE